ncbi:MULTISPECIES: TetR/AcrR family transcriptional regulator [unclassified Bacillus (in: firmicutes)]|uniref:TetR/AcrR family transcriptional regulator n=1 Tax=unclassified Bacillus (in: firmicutes) TaxID=185979 RepID=UPI002281ACD4|nr:WHG domain-containing protein [Bacillus sp. S20C3]MCY8202654.1 WHG domain-containing protein [Bacillus sp. N12A5]MCY8287621.1 WHG domain-containing protein [Bacillus sp. N13C7]MCY8639308.1 WHG domain-containing protein [Bacillus sp. S17B2]MCY8721161.1 WHG domain-containing protein [Bacillus sp. S10C12M]MCY9142760.1 WHG domain-containing protein [Bacillus sp. T9C1]
MSPRIGLSQKMIVDAAAEIADQEGLNGVTLAALSKKMNVRSPSLYNHINGLQAIRTELAVSGLTKLYDQMADAVTVQKGDSALFSLAQAYVDFAVENPGYYEAALLKIQDKRAEIVSDQIVRLVANLLIDNGYASEKTAIHATRGLRSLLHGFTALIAKEAFEREEDILESLSFSIRTFLAGLSKNNKNIM